jgi:hypothetical protein
MTEVTLPSGAVLKITPADFETSKALYQAFLEEMKVIKLSGKDEMADVFKNLACIGFSSKKIETCLWKCFERVTYNSGNGDLKISKDTFEPVAAREDYMAVCIAVAKENILPFMKSLYAEYGQFLEMMPNDQS